MAEVKEVGVDIVDEDENIFLSKFSLEVEKESASYGFALANPMDQVATSVAAGPVAGASVATGPVAGAPIAAGPMAAAPAADRTAADRTAAGRTAAGRIIAANPVAGPAAAGRIAAGPAAAAGPIAANEPSVDSTWQVLRPRGRAAGIRRQQEHFVRFLYQLSHAYYPRGNRGRGRGRGRGTI